MTSRVGDCVAPAPGEGVVFSAEGFAPGSLVEVEQFGTTVAGGGSEFAGVGVGAC